MADLLGTSATYFNRSIFDLCSAQERSCWVRTTFEKTDILVHGNARCNATSTGTILSTLQAPSRPARQNHPFFTCLDIDPRVLYFPTRPMRVAIRRWEPRSRGPCLFFKIQCRLCMLLPGSCIVGYLLLPVIVRPVTAPCGKSQRRHPAPSTAAQTRNLCPTTTLFMPLTQHYTSRGVPDGGGMQLS